jgi:hypothetical protein
MARMQKRNEGGRCSAQHANDWYKAIEAANLARIEEEYALAGQRNLTEAEWMAQDTTEYGEASDGDLVPWDRAA